MIAEKLENKTYHTETLAKRLLKLIYTKRPESPLAKEEIINLFGGKAYYLGAFTEELIQFLLEKGYIEEKKERQFFVSKTVIPKLEPGMKFVFVGNKRIKMPANMNYRPGIIETGMTVETVRDLNKRSWETFYGDFFQITEAGKEYSKKNLLGSW